MTGSIFLVLTLKLVEMPKNDESGWIHAHGVLDSGLSGTTESQKNVTAGNRCQGIAWAAGDLDHSGSLCSRRTIHFRHFLARAADSASTNDYGSGHLAARQCRDWLARPNAVREPDMLCASIEARVQLMDNVAIGREDDAAIELQGRMQHAAAALDAARESIKVRNLNEAPRVVGAAQGCYFQLCLNNVNTSQKAQVYGPFAVN